MNVVNQLELHVVMFPFLAFGHINPFVQLSNKLSSHGVRVSFFSAPGNIDRIKTTLNLTPTTQIIPLTIPPVDGLPPGLDSTADTTPLTSELLKIALDQMQPQIKILLSELTPHFVFYDFGQQWLPPLASQLGIKTIFFSIFGALCTAFVTIPGRLSDHDQLKTSPTLEEMKRPPPGFPQTSVTSLRTFEARDFLYVFKSFHGGSSVYDRVLTCLKGCDAILVKSCREMEAPYIDFVTTQFDKPVLLAGPVIPEPPTGMLEERWDKWLGQFPAKSVVFCSFGSEAFLKDDQIRELVLGLELTGLPFFMVLKFPADVDGSAELDSALPEGFLERVKDRGVVYAGWVQQQHILAHVSVGCCLCHAGRSSVIETLVNDCQLVMLTNKGDQFLNSKLVAGDLKAGLEVNRRDEDGYFCKEDICMPLRQLMVEVDKEPGKSVRANQEKWKMFLLNKEIQNKFVTDLVKGMKTMDGMYNI
ncbi:anthocyanidin-3-O-glucoside rhamnosyltransferase-like [Cornus florida]|uniref:anthocyanidin-3-O-glucoside rhamnosyltransferase-like n=1 Tax=Cornus florida TaxID=4283 RepID=UPI00289A84C5|nr:anthocyanidin-3-O-glucoside rhamnosyltransferase-like [Cornus florida]